MDHISTGAASARHPDISRRSRRHTALSHAEATRARPATCRRDTRYPPRSAGIFLCPPALSAPTGQNPRPRPRPRTPSNGGSTGERRRVRRREDPERPDARRTRDRPTAAAVSGVGARTIRRRDIRARTDRLPRSDGRTVPGPAAPSRSFLSDDSTPVEFSLSFTPDAPTRVRVLLEPGCGADSLRENGRTGLRVVRSMARRWGFATEQLDALEDLFLPPTPRAPWRCGSRWNCAPAASPR